MTLQKKQVIDGYYIIPQYLKNNGYEGLVSGEGCGCSLDDLMPCGGEFAMGCEAGYKVPGCTEECGQGCDFHIFPGKRPDQDK